MTTRRVWLALVVLAVVVVAVYWALTTGSRESQVVPEAKLAATASAPVPSASVAAPSPGNESHKARQTKPSIWRKPNHVVASDGTAAVPSRYQIAGVKRVQTGRDFDDWMSHFPEQDQKVLRGFDKRFYGVYQGRNPRQIAWMAAHGYPMPEDVLAAKFIDTAKLRDMAKQGNVKAAFLLKDRELSEIAQKMEAHDKSYGQIAADDPRLRQDKYMLRDTLAASDSPYRALLRARDATVRDSGDPRDMDSEVIGALYAAHLLGDNGTPRMVKSFVNASSDPSVLAYRQAVAAGASSVYRQFLRRRAARGSARLPLNECINLFGGDDLYPADHPHN